MLAKYKSLKDVLLDIKDKKILKKLNGFFKEIYVFTQKDVEKLFSKLENKRLEIMVITAFKNQILEVLYGKGKFYLDVVEGYPIIMIKGVDLFKEKKFEEKNFSIQAFNYYFFRGKDIKNIEKKLSKFKSF